MRSNHPLRYAKRSRQRNNRAFSIPMVMGMALIVGFWLSGLAALIVPAAAKISHQRLELNVRAGAESTADWAVSQLNNIYSGTSTSMQDDITVNGTPTPNGTQGQAVGCSLPSGVTAQVWINNVPPPVTSYIYDPALNPAVNSSIPTAPAGKSYGWRIITATATASGYSKTVRVICRPTYPVSNLFQQAVFSNGPQTWTGNHSDLDGYNSATGVRPIAAGGAGSNNGHNDIASTQPIELGGSVNGNVTYYGTGSTTVGQANITGGSGSPAIWGQVQTTDAFAAGGPLVAQSGEAASQIGGNIINPDGTTSVGAKYAAPPGPPPSITVPSAPSTANVLTSWTSSGYSYKNSAGTTISGSSGSLPPGDYTIANNLTMTQGMSAGGGSGAVRVWPSGNLAINGGGDLTNYASNRLQIYYSGSGASTASISLNGSGGQFCGVVMAPNVNMAVNGQGHFFGAVVCNSLVVHGSGNSGSMSYDQALMSNPISFPGSPQLTVISWQEL